MKRGEIYIADLGSVIGSEQGGKRPVLIIQNDIGNKFSPTVIIAAITSQKGKTNIPTHVFVKAGEGGLRADSIVLLEQIRTVGKERLLFKVGAFPLMEKIDKALKISMGLNEKK